MCQNGESEAVSQHTDQQRTQPPEAPDIERRTRLYLFQWIGILLIAVIPVLALLGLFGQKFDNVSASADQVELQVRYPTRVRYKMLNPLEIVVWNRSEQTIDTLTVSIDQRYLESFSNITFVPSVETVTEDAYIVEFNDIRAGSSQRAHIEFQGEKYGRHAGDIRLQINGQPITHVSLATLVFP